MEKLEKGSKIYLDKDNTKESAVNSFLDCRDGLVECYEYNDMSGYGARVKLFLCENTKHECTSIIRQTKSYIDSEWSEEVLEFDTDSFKFLTALLSGKRDELGGVYTFVRDYSKGE